MDVWILYQYDGMVEGVYTEAGKAVREQQRLDEAMAKRERQLNFLASEITELREMRQPYITEAEMLLDTERAAKESNNTGLLKSTRKQRKVLLKQAEKLTYDIQCKEEKILAAQRLTKADLLYSYGDGTYWEDYYLQGEVN
jgi:phosphoglycerate-specific signal transduction histidine kinase